MNFRFATLEDTEPVAGLHTDSWRRTYRGMYPDEFLDGDLLDERRSVWRGRLERPPANQLVVVAVEGEELAGFVCAYGNDDAVWGSLIDNLHVDHRFRRQGMGAALMTRVATSLESSNGETGVYLWVLKDNNGARMFYERLGATNAETVHMKLQPGNWGHSCRYVWPNPAALLSA